MMTKTMKAMSFGAREQGVALIMSLVMLLILTILGISSVQTTSMQERMTLNARDNDLAFQAAESAVREAENYLSTNTSLLPFQDANTDGRYDAPDNGAVDMSAFDWATAGNNDRGFKTVATTLDGVADQPKYIIEWVKTVVSEEDTLNLNNIGQDTGSGRTQMFRVTAYGTGGTDTAHVMIQTTYGKRF